MLLVVEVFHGLVVEQAVDGLGVGVLVCLVHAAAVFEAPFRDRQRVPDIADDGDEGNEREPEIVEAPEDAADQRDLQQGRHDIEQHEEQKILDAGRTTLDDARQPAGLALEVEAQGQPMQMDERAQRNAADGALRDLRENAVAQFGEALRHHAGAAIGQQHGDGEDDRAGRLQRQPIDHALEEDRHVDVGDLGRHQTADRQHHPHAQIPVAGRPQMRQQLPQRGALAGWRRRSGVRDRSHATNSTHSPAPCGRGAGGGVCARKRAGQSIILGARTTSCRSRDAPAGASPRPLPPAHKGRGNALCIHPHSSAVP